MDFRSDNTHGCSPEVLEAMARAAAGTMTSYGGDEITARLRDRFSRVFETEVDVFPVMTGTAANALSIAAMKPARIVCHAEAHIELEELGAAAWFSGGTIVPLGGAGGKLQSIDAHEFDCLSITQATEAGTLYSLEELRALCGLARARGAMVQMDGARFANAVAALGCTAAEMTWRAGVDVLAFGGTKNGTIGAEAIVVFRRELSEQLGTLLHRSGHRVSKMRFVSAQLEAVLEDGLWLRNARHANAAARRLADGLRGVVEIVQPVEANVVFVRFGDERAARLRARGFAFHEWFLFGAGVYRLVTAFDTTDEEVDALIAAVRET